MAAEAEPKKSELLTTAHEDGACDAMAFAADHLLALRWVFGGDRMQQVVIDLERALVEPSTHAVAEGAGKLLPSDSRGERIAVSKAGSIEVRKKDSARVSARLQRAGKLRWLDDDTLFSSRGEVLNRWTVSSGKAKKFKFTTT